MAFKSIFVAISPDADPEKDTARIETPHYVLVSMLAHDAARAIQACRRFHEVEPIDSIVLCPGFTHDQVAAMFRAFDGKVAVAVARADSVSGQLAIAALKKAGVSRHG